MNISSLLSEETTVALFNQLAASDVRYTVLRNAERFPSFNHDIDLVVATDAIENFQRILTSLAEEYRWDALVSCKHWHTSTHAHHNIHIFKLYKLNPLQTLQIDLFHGYLIYSLPFMDEATLLSRSVEDTRGFYKLASSTENLFRLFQIHAHLKAIEPQQEKINAYQRAVVVEFEDPTSSLKSDLTRYFGEQGLQTLHALNTQDFHSFVRHMDRIKLKFWLAHILKQPIHTLHNVYCRFLDYCHVYLWNPCGFLLRVYCPDTGDKRVIYDALERLKQANIIPNWGDALKINFAKKRRILERGGIVIQWSSNKHRSIAFAGDSGLSETAVNAQIVQAIIAHHDCLYASEQMQGIAS